MQGQLDRQDKSLQDADEKFSKLTDELGKKIASSIEEEHRFSEACSDRVKTQVRLPIRFLRLTTAHARVRGWAGRVCARGGAWEGIG